MRVGRVPLTHRANLTSVTRLPAQDLPLSGHVLPLPALPIHTRSRARAAAVRAPPLTRRLSLADAYYGQNTKIRDTLNNLITKSPQEWHTQVALPFVKIVGTTVEWDVRAPSSDPPNAGHARARAAAICPVPPC